MNNQIKNKYELLLLKNQLCFPMYSATNRIVNNYRPLIIKIDLSYTQYIVMMVVWEKKKLKYSEHFPLTPKEVTALKEMFNKIVNWKISNYK